MNDLEIFREKNMTIWFGIKPEELDDKNLDKQIKAIAQTLCNVHHLENYRIYGSYYNYRNVPLIINNKEDEFAKWAQECVANYKYLVELGEKSIEEYRKRFNGEPERLNKYSEAIIWAVDNVPDLPAGEMIVTADIPSTNQMELITPFPLVMPDIYWVIIADGKQPYTYDIIESYRNYFVSKINKIKDKLGRNIPKGTHLKCIRCQDVYPVICSKHTHTYCGHCYSKCPKCNPDLKMKETCGHDEPGIIYNDEVNICTYSLKNMRYFPVWTRREKPQWLIR